jgi:hypothetical protein
MSELQIGDRVIAIVDDDVKITGSVRSLGPPPQGSRVPIDSVHINLDRSLGMFVTRWVPRPAVSLLPVGN